MKVAVFAIAAICALEMCGCGKNDGLLDVYPTEGKLLLDGEPLGNVQVRLVPGELKMDGSTHSVSGYVDENGTITFSTYDAGDGAPAGDYGVSVTVNPMRQPTRRFPAVYTSEKTSNVTVSIRPDKDVNDLTIELSSTAGRRLVGGSDPRMQGMSTMLPGQLPSEESE